jgi:hypothetical protein
MPTTERDARFLLRMIHMMLAGAAALVVGILLDPFTPDSEEH